MPVLLLVLAAAAVLILNLAFKVDIYNIAAVLFFDLLVVILFALFFWSQVALFYAIVNEKAGVKEAYANGRKMLWAYFVLSFLTGLVIFGGFALLIIPGIFFYVWLILSTFVFVAEGEKEVGALIKSYDYVKSHSWQAFLRILFITLVFVIGGELITFVLKVFRFDEESAKAFSNIISFFFYPLPALYYFQMYKNLKTLKKEVASKENKLVKTIFTIFALLTFVLIAVGIIYLVLHPKVINILRQVLTQG
jgi:hypothetical protein